MKRSIGILLGLLLVAGSDIAQAGRSGGGFHGGGRAVAARAAPSGGFARFTTGPTRFTTGPMRFTTGPHPGRPIGIPPPPPGSIARPIPVAPPVVHGGTVVVTAPVFYPSYPYAYPYPYPYPYVAPVAGGSVYAGMPTYSDAPAYSYDPNNPEAPGNEETPGYSERNDYWYYCPDSQTYYPYVPTCQSPWIQVLPGAEPGAPN